MVDFREPSFGRTGLVELVELVAGSSAAVGACAGAGDAGIVLSRFLVASGAVALDAAFVELGGGRGFRGVPNIAADRNVVV
jgi:hypothetical protein